jgi:hypothetical protein
VDRNNDRIQKFDNNGNFITKWDVVAFQPIGIAADSFDNIYVTAIDNGINIVSKFTSSGEFIKSWFVGSPNPEFDTQNAIAIDSSDNLYVSSNNQIFKFTTDGEFIKSWGSKGSSNGQFNQIVGIATDDVSNNVYVTDKYNLRVQKFASNGDFITGWGASCQTNRVFCSEPQGISTDLSGNVYVTEYNAGRISKFTTNGQFITGWDVPSAFGIDVDLPGNVYVSTGTDLIQIYRPISTSPPSPPDTTIDSAVDRNNFNVPNGGSTISNQITFTFTGTTDPSISIAGFECSLDKPAFSQCSSAITYNNLNTGPHLFEVRAIDTSGNKDPTPATFTWKIITPSQAIQRLIDTINNMDISMGAKTSLAAPLKNALKLLIDNNPENDEAVCGRLAALLAQVNSKEANSQLTSSQAAELRQQAIAIKNSLGC